MDKARLMGVLNETTYLISKGPVTRRSIGGMGVLLWGLLLSPSDPRVGTLQQVDCSFVCIGVDEEKATRVMDELISILDEYPNPRQLRDGPSYKHVAEVVGDDVTALRLFGLGQVLGLWSVLTPFDFDVEPVLVEEAAELGMVVISGYPAQVSYGLTVAAG